MEVGLSVSCNFCGFEDHFKVGVGFMYQSLEDVIDLIHPERHPQALKLLKKHKVRETVYERRIYRCERCGQLRNVFWVKIMYDDKEIYETDFQCGECQKHMLRINDPLQINSYPCPSCGRIKLRVEVDIDLD